MSGYVPDMRGMSAKSALRMAIAYSGKSNEEIRMAMGWSSSFAKKIFSSQEAMPSFVNMPKLCSVLGNRILPQWILQNMDNPVSNHEAMDAYGLLADMASMFELMGNFAKTGHAAIADWKLSREESWDLLHQLRDFFEIQSCMFAELEEALHQKRGHNGSV